MVDAGHKHYTMTEDPRRCASCEAESRRESGSTLRPPRQAKLQTREVAEPPQGIASTREERACRSVPLRGARARSEGTREEPEDDEPAGLLEGRAELEGHPRAPGLEELEELEESREDNATAAGASDVSDVLLRDAWRQTQWVSLGFLCTGASGKLHFFLCKGTA